MAHQHVIDEVLAMGSRMREQVAAGDWHAAAASAAGIRRALCDELAIEDFQHLLVTNKDAMVGLLRDTQAAVERAAQHRDQLELERAALQRNRGSISRYAAHGA